MRDADVAMYRAKADGSGAPRRVRRGDARAGDAPLDMESELRRAIERARSRSLYQPIVHVATGRIAGFEALVPLAAPAAASSSRPISSPIAEETGLIVPLGAWVLREACVQLAEWRASCRSGAGADVGVNVSAASSPTRASSSCSPTRSAQRRSSPRALRLEITESELIARPRRAAQRALAHTARALGVRSHIDDFGTGASSLRLLHGFPGDAVKIHRALVIGMGHDAGAFEIVKALVGARAQPRAGGDRGGRRDGRAARPCCRPSSATSCRATCSAARSASRRWGSDCRRDVLV